MRGQALEKLHQLDAALAAYHLILEKYANSKQAPAAQLRAAQLHDQLGQDREAAELFEQLASQRPEPPNLDAVLYQWAWVLVDLERPDEADAIFNRLWRDCRSSEYWADAAYRLAERAARAEDHERAIRLADEIIASHCDRAILAHALYLKGQSAAAMGRWEEVDAPMSRIMNEFSDSELLLPAEYWAAEALYRRGRYEEAGRRFDNLSKKTQGRDDAWLGMIPLRQAQVLAHKKQWQESFELAQTIERRFPKFRQQYEADYLLGRCHSSQGRFDDARAAYERVIRSPAGGQTETAAMAQWMIGESYLHQKSYDEAIRAYHRVEGLFAYPHWQAAALLQAGKCHEMKSNWNEAVKLYAQILKEYPKTTFTEEAGRRMRVAQQRATKPAAPPENDSRPASQRTHS
jgi:TolA-binding protein